MKRKLLFVSLLLTGLVILWISPGIALAVTNIGAGGWNSTPISEQLHPTKPVLPRPPVPTYPMSYPYGYGPYGPVIYDSYYGSPYVRTSSFGATTVGDGVNILSNQRKPDREAGRREKRYVPSGPPTETTYELKGTLFPGQGFILLRFMQEGRPVGMKVKTNDKTQYLPRGYNPRPGDRVLVRYYHIGPDQVAQTIKKIK